MRILVNIGLILFVIWTSLLIAMYPILLYDKITKPQFKNMNSTDVWQFGLLAIALGAIDFFIIRHLIRSYRKRQ
jgi:hypothetical protein